MKRFLVLIAAATALGRSAQAEPAQALHGLFCNTEEQIEQTVAHMRLGLPPRNAADLTNERAVVCVYADRIQYVITGLAMVGQARVGGGVFMKYEVTLVGVLVGGNLRPVDPPVRLFLLSGDRLSGAAVKRTI